MRDYPIETKFCVNISQARINYVWGVDGDIEITNKREFASIAPSGYADGTILDTILVQPSAKNCNWGWEDEKTLYISAGNYKVNFQADDLSCETYYYQQI
jgi:hypothetical protein